LHWSINKRYNEFFSLYEQLRDICPYTKDLEFPKKRIAMKNSPKLVEMRIIGLELYIRKALHTLTLYASMDNSASKGLRHLQQFLGVDRKIDCIHPPPMDDQRAIEIMAYQFLNDYNSPACQQCVRFISSIEFDNLLETGEEGYKPLLQYLHDAVAEVEQFVQQQHEQQLASALKHRRPEWTDEQRMKLVRLCIRRQVESALYLPMRRNVFRIVQSFVADKSRKLHHAIALLQHAKPSVFMVDYEISRTVILPKAIRAFRKAILSYLPVDQGQFLVESAKIIAELHTECREIKQQAESEKNKANHINNGNRSPTNHNKSSDHINNHSENGKGGKPPLVRSPSSGTENNSNKNSSKLPPSQRSFTGILSSVSSGITGMTITKPAVERRPSLQDKIQNFVEAANETSSKLSPNNNNNSGVAAHSPKDIAVVGSYDAEDFGDLEEENVLRVSFAVAPNQSLTYSSKRKLVSEKDRTSYLNYEKDIKELTASPEHQQSSSSANPLFTTPEKGVSPPKPPLSSPQASQPPRLSAICEETDRLSDLPPPSSSSAPSSAVKENSPTRRKSFSRPTSLLRKVSNAEMMSDPLLRPLAVELSGENIDKSYFEEVFDRYTQTFSFHEHDTSEDVRKS
jgi:hypothetical protein